MKAQLLALLGNFYYISNISQLLFNEENIKECSDTIIVLIINF